jgi:uncharacterized protein (DUF2132 family)
MIPGAQIPMSFDGPSYQPQRDQARLTGQILRVFELMKDRRWRTLREIAQATGDPEPSISSQLRHLRKARFGSHKIERAYVRDGLYIYRLIERKA